MHSCDVAGGHNYVYENTSSPAKCEFGRPSSPLLAEADFSWQNSSQALAPKQISRAFQGPGSPPKQIKVCAPFVPRVHFIKQIKVGRGGRNVKRFGFVKRLSRLFSRATGARPVSHSASGQRAERLLQVCLQPSRTRCGGSYSGLRALRKRTIKKPRRAISAKI